MPKPEGFDAFQARLCEVPGLLIEEWMPFDPEKGYAKFFADVRLKDGRMIKGLYPNGGTFNGTIDGLDGRIRLDEIQEVFYHSWQKIIDESDSPTSGGQEEKGG